MSTSDPRARGAEPADPCTEFRERLSAQRDGIDAGEGAWRRHALACATCAELAARLDGALDELAVLRGTPTPDLWTAIAARAPRRSSSPRRVASSIGAALIGAAAAWMFLTWIERRSRPADHGDAGVERALATLRGASEPGEGLQHMEDRPELRLLASLGQLEGRR